MATEAKIVKVEKPKQIKMYGRQKGTPNAITSDYREKIHNVIDSLYEKLPDDLVALEPKERVNAFLQLMKYVCPKMSDSGEHQTVIKTRSVVTNIIQNAGIILKEIEE